MKLNNILQTIKTICYNQPNVNTVFVGDIYDLNTQKDIEYSVMAITEQTHTVNSNDGYEVWGINLFYVDRQTSDNSNILDVHSHAVEVLNSVVNELEEIGVIIENTYQINTFNERFAALCSGAYVTLNLRVPLATCDKYELVHSVNGMRGDVIINTSNPISQIEEGNTKDSVNSVAVINYVAPIKDRVSSAETNITTLQSTKQDNLISGTNIKTVNGNSLLGSGDITIDCGSNFIGKLGSYTTYLSGFLNALSAKGAVSNFQGISKDAAQVGDIFVIEAKAADTHDYYIFVLECETPKTNDVRGHTIYSYIIRDYELWSNKVTQITSASTDIQYPSAKAVFDELQKKQDTLVSGTNIKTINGNSILGSGNLVIQGGGGGEPTQYIKDASVSGNTLTLTKKDDSKVEFTPQGGGDDTMQRLLAGQTNYILYEDINGDIKQVKSHNTVSHPIWQNNKMKKVLCGTFDTLAYAFYYCSNVEEIYPTIVLSSSDNADYQNAFQQTPKLKKLDLSHIDFTQITQLVKTFNGCGLEEISIDTPNVVTFNNTFGSCLAKKLKFDVTDKCTTLQSQVLMYSRNLEVLDTTSWDMVNVTVLDYQELYSCDKLHSLIGEHTIEEVENGDIVAMKNLNVNFSLKPYGKTIPLDRASILALIYGLADVNDKEEKPTLYLASYHRNLLSQDELDIATNKGWTIA